MSTMGFYKKIVWYLKKHGLKNLIFLSITKAWRKINNKELIHVFDLNSTVIKINDVIQNVSIEAFENIESIPSPYMNQLIHRKSEEVLIPFLKSFFERGATLWLGEMDNQIVGLVWSLVGGFKGFYSVPIAPNDMILLAVEVFPEFRGKRIAVAMRLLLYEKFKKLGISRVYGKIHVSNIANLKSIRKQENVMIGSLRTFEIFNKYITIWDKNSLWRFN